MRRRTLRKKENFVLILSNFLDFEKALSLLNIFKFLKVYVGFLTTDIMIVPFLQCPVGYILIGTISIAFPLVNRDLTYSIFF